MGVRVGLWSVCNGWLLVDGARCYGVWVGGLLVVACKLPPPAIVKDASERRHETPMHQGKEASSTAASTGMAS